MPADSNGLIPQHAGKHTSTMIIVAAMLSMLFPAAASSQYPWGYPYGYPGSQGIPPAQAPSVDSKDSHQPSAAKFRQPIDPRAWPQQPMGWPPPQAVPYQSTQAPEAPLVETTISSQNAVEQQNLIYRIRVISSGNLKTAVPQMPLPDGFVMRLLGEPQSHSQQQNNKQKIITEHTYLLVPLRAGMLTLPPANVTGEYDNGQAYDIRGSQPLYLTVQPAVKGIAPWLPLHDLQMQAYLLDAHNPSAGNPITLRVTIKAVGATGAQIPSIASQLRSDNFRIYPAETTTEGKLSTDGLRLQGQHTENFTLVPQYGGKLSIPALQLNWWNIDQQQLQTTSVPIRSFNVKGPPRPANTINDPTNTVLPIDSLIFWIPLMLAGIILLVGWFKILMGNGRLPGINWIADMFKGLLGDLYHPVATFTRKLSPRRHFHRLRTLVGRNLPISWKLWFCLRSVDKEDEAEEWSQALQILAHKHLGVRSHANLPELGASIAACHPKANTGEIARLMNELDKDIYGEQPMQSFAQWKKSLKQQIKPRLFPIRFRHCRKANNSQYLLPDLNPLI
jgi:hypothetical protein